MNSVVTEMQRKKQDAMRSAVPQRYDMFTQEVGVMRGAAVVRR